MQINVTFKNLIPPLTTEEYKQLEENVLRDGVREPLVIWNDTLIDGHNRYEICTKHKIPFDTFAMKFDNENKAIEWIIRNQFGRRNLNFMQRGELILTLAPIIREEANKRQLATLKQNSTDVQNSAPRENSKSRDELAKLAGVSHDTIGKVEVIVTKGTEEQIQRAREGGKGNSVNAIANEIKAAEVATKVCRICGDEKPISGFYESNSNMCKQCHNKRAREQKSVKDFKGDVIVSIKDRNKVSLALAEEIAKDLYDNEKVVVIDSSDLSEDIECFATYFARNSERCVNQYSVTVTEENKQKIIAALSKVEAAIEKLKGIFMNE